MTQRLGARVPAGRAAHLQVAGQRPGGARGDPAQSTWRASRKALARFLTKDQLALYRLIWERFLASQMHARASTTRWPPTSTAGRRACSAPRARPEVHGLHRGLRGDAARRTSGRRGGRGERDAAARGGRGAARCSRLDPKQHFTQPPPRFTEASLIKALEELGIGRPSTYASILGTIINDRGYVHRERRTLFPTELGMQVTDMLVPYFPEIMDVEFTAQMED